MSRDPNHVDPLPAEGAPHAYAAVWRLNSPHADRPEWDQRKCLVVPEWDREHLDHLRSLGYALLPIGPDGDTGTRAISTGEIEVADFQAACKSACEQRDAALSQLAKIKAADPDLFDPTGGTDRGAAYETYGSAGEELREKFLAAIGVNVNDYDEVPDGE